MRADEFIRRREAAWQQLEALLGKAQREVSALDESELHALGRLYRQVTSDLALSRRDFPQERVTAYLNELVARAHPLIYRAEPVRRREIVTFFARTFPALYRHIYPYTLAATLLFVLPALLAFAAVWRQPEFITTLAGQGIRDLVETVESGKLWTDIAPEVRSAGASLIFTNNIQVMFLTFAGGITAGLYSAWIVLLNGVHFGAIFGLLQYHGLSGGLADFVVGHGFIELSVIFLAGGCGLYMGDGLLRPGLQSRGAALAARAQDGVKLILGCVPLLIVAGLIEGFVSPSGAPAWLKVLVGISTGAALHAYWWMGGRSGSTVLPATTDQRPTTN